MSEDQRPACRSLAIGHTIYDSSSKPVFLDPKMLDGSTMGESTDNVWVGHCATGRTQIVEVDAGCLATLAGMGSLEK